MAFEIKKDKISKSLGEDISVEAPSKKQQTNDETRDSGNYNTTTTDMRKKGYATTTKTTNLVSTVLTEAEMSFKIKQIEGKISKKMSFGMYLSDLIYQDLHNGEQLFDYTTGDPLQEIE